MIRFQNYTNQHYFKKAKQIKLTTEKLKLTRNMSIKNLDRTLLYWSSLLNEPFSKAWELGRFRLLAPLDLDKFENYSNRIQEIAVRILIGTGACAACALCFLAPLPFLGTLALLSITSRVLRTLGFAHQKEGYTHVIGEAHETPIERHLRVLTWNVCGVFGGMSLDHGGVINWRARVPKILEQIKNENPDVIVFQEIYDTTLAETILENLKSSYSHFFMHLGKNVWGSVGGGMIITRCPLVRFSHHEFTNNSFELTRGFGVLELKNHPQDSQPSVRIIGTHLIHGDSISDQQKRAEQLTQIKHFVDASLPLPTILAGDLNIERDGIEGRLLTAHLTHGFNQKEPTCTNRLVAQWDHEKKSVWAETIDYISLFQPANSAKIHQCHLVRSYDQSFNTQTALSDHHGLVADVQLNG